MSPVTHRHTIRARYRRGKAPRFYCATCGRRHHPKPKERA